jgi:formylmethanofuran dehydrogenase subunit C
MRRGTVGLLGPEMPKLLPTFRRGCRYRPLFLQLLFRDLRRLGFPVSDDFFNSEYRLYHGDMVAAGRGEILLRESVA